MKIRKLAHIINPVVVGESSDLFIAQPITFETMKIAQTFAQDQVKVALYSAQYPSDRPLVPRHIQLFAEWSRYWDLEKPYLLEKSPPNLIKSRFLQALFPDACFIMIIRHPIAVSLATQKWTPRTPLYVLIWHWLVCHEQFESDQVHLRKVLTLHYEQLVANPQAILRQIYDFLGIEQVPLKQEVRSAINKRYFLRWEEMRQGRWLERLYAKLITFQFERRVNRFGYSLKEIHNREAIKNE